MKFNIFALTAIAAIITSMPAFSSDHSSNDHSTGVYNLGEHIQGEHNPTERTPADLNDQEIAHVAYTANTLDIRYAYLALAISKNNEIREYAKIMVRDHEAVNKQALALLSKLKTSSQDNFLSQTFNQEGEKVINKLSSLRGNDFDRFYAENELSFHKTVNSVLSQQFIPNIESTEVKILFKAALSIFKSHQRHASTLVQTLENSE